MEENTLIQSQLNDLECMENCAPEDLVAEVTTNQRKMLSNAEIYYNEERDRVSIKRYYRNLSPHPAASTQRFRELQRLIRRTHKRKYPYYISKDQFLYTWVDLHPDGQLKGIYSGIQQSPQEVIEEEFETIQKRFEQYRNFIKSEMKSRKDIKKQIRFISNQHKFNAEHVVPQSWFKSKEPMRGDLHHLFACQPKCNSARANYAYYDFQLNGEARKPRNPCGLYDVGRFEPMYGKGAVARAMLYFLLRYPKKILKTYRKRINLPLLFQWHVQFPVSEYEKHRNQAIFEIQGNRNPFIDLPGLTDAKGFPF